MIRVFRNPSMQLETFDRPVRSVNCYDNGPWGAPVAQLDKSWPDDLAVPGFGSRWRLEKSFQP